MGVDSSNNVVKKGLISVIVPVYNREKRLRMCVDSILAQSYRNLEVILVDDGSTDSSPAICDQYAELDKRVKVVHKENGGPSSARNAGLSVVTGEYIGFVDSDDYISDKMYEILLSGMDPEIDICICFFQRYDPETDDVMDVNIDIAVKDYTTIELEKELYVNPNSYKDVFICAVWNKLIRRHVLNGMFFKGDYYEDSALMDKVYCKVYKARVINSRLYYYTINDNSLSSGKFNKTRLLPLIVFANRSVLFNDEFVQLNARKQFCLGCLGYYFRTKELGIRYKRKTIKIFTDNTIILFRKRKINFDVLVKSVLFIINPDAYGWVVQAIYGLRQTAPFKIHIINEKC